MSNFIPNVTVYWTNKATDARKGQTIPSLGMSYRQTRIYRTNDARLADCKAGGPLVA